MTAPPQIRQLTDADSIFVSVESPEAPSHVAGLVLLDPSTSSSFGFERFLDNLCERIELVPRFKWKLKEIPLGMDQAYWVEDSAFDARQHVQRIAVPKPGNRAALARLAGILHEFPLDRSRPLWESWWIEGLEGGRVAMLMKIHHSLMDGQSGVGLTEVLMDSCPAPRRATSPSKDMQDAAPRNPRIWEVAQRMMGNGLHRQNRLAVHTGRAARDFMRYLNTASDGPPAPRIPRTSFNRRLSRHRKFAFATIPFEPLRNVKKHLDVKMNDLLLEIVSSSLRRGLRKMGDLPSMSLVALCPVSLREAGDRSFGNQLTSMPVTLATHLENPCARLAAIRFSAQQAKRRTRGAAFEVLTALTESLPPAALRLMTRSLHIASDRLPLPANLVFSNVRGLSIPTYMAGARVEELYPMSMLQVANGMNVTAVTHDDQVDFGFLVDPTLIADPWLFADGVPSALEELELAVSDSLSADSATRRPPQVRQEPVEAKPTSSTEPDESSRETPTDPPIEWESDPLDMSLVMADHDRTQPVADKPL